MPADARNMIWAKLGNEEFGVLIDRAIYRSRLEKFVRVGVYEVLDP